MEVMKAHKDDARNGTPIGAPRPKAPKFGVCTTFRHKVGSPGQRCDKSNCKLFPCVSVGSPPERHIRRLFDADPDVTAWRAQ